VKRFTIAAPSSKIESRDGEALHRREVRGINGSHDDEALHHPQVRGMNGSRDDEALHRRRFSDLAYAITRATRW
jgi:hypothetical protein